VKHSLLVTYHADTSSTARAGTNYKPLIGTVLIPAGSSGASITITPIDDRVPDSGKTLTLILSNGRYAIEADHQQAALTIANSDSDPRPPLVLAAKLPPSEPTDPDGTYFFTYVNVADEPLFGAGGPSMNDVGQSFLGDCYFMASVAAIARADPTAIRRLIRQNTDGTYDVAFHAHRREVDVHVDGWIPGDEFDGVLGAYYGQLGHDNSAWVAILEKAYAVFTSPKGAPSYQRINAGGVPSYVFADLGCSSDQTFYSRAYDPAYGYGLQVHGAIVQSTAAMTTGLERALSVGKGVCISTIDQDVAGPLRQTHEYSVISITTDSSGQQMINLRDPQGGDPNHGYISFTAQQVWHQLYGFDVVRT
jgi:hypothetical protein